ncbi:MAG: amylo-alpha-1,6-glucosidase [Candidatus Korarchaeota archaeon]
MKSKKLFVFVIFSLLIIAFESSLFVSVRGPVAANEKNPNIWSQDPLAIDVKHIEPYEYVYTNKNGTYFADATRHIRLRRWEGLWVRRYKFLEDVYLKLGLHGDDVVLNEYTCVGATILPEKAIRYYEINGMLFTEELLVPLGYHALLVRYNLTGYSGKLTWYIQYDLHRCASGTYSVLWNDANNTFALTISGLSTAPYRYIAATANVDLDFHSEEYWPSKTYAWDKMRGEGGEANVYQPGYLQSNAVSSVVLAFAVDYNENTARGIASTLVNKFDALAAQRRAYFDALLENLDFHVSEPDVEKAFKWSVISLDNLINNDQDNTFGIWAGIPWFCDFWGRDTFISLPAVIIAGMFSDAYRIIDTMRGMQNTNSNDIFYGRVPNRAVPGSGISYTTADGTPWFVHGIMDYLRYSGNLTGIIPLYNAIKTAINGEITKRLNTSLGFIRESVFGHPAETWMDAYNPSLNLSYTPRADMAVEIEALWYVELLIGAEIAELTGNNADAQNWRQLAETVRTNFERFWCNENGSLYDFLWQGNVVGGSHKKRPNQLFAISVVYDDMVPLLDEIRAYSVAQFVHTWNVFPHGVASLSRDDPDYRGYDNMGAGDDTPYHNGMVWLWLHGPATTAFIRVGMINESWHLTSLLVDHVLCRGALGTMNEILPGDVDWPTGTFSQAWSLAEFIRNVYQDYMGVRPNAITKHIYLEPVLPPSIVSMSGKMRIENGYLSVEESITNTGMKLVLSPSNITTYTLNVTIRVPKNATMNIVRVNGNEQSFSRKEHVYGEALNFAVSLSKTTTIEIQFYPTPPSEEAEFPWIVILSVGVIVCVAAIIFLLVRRFLFAKSRQKEVSNVENA